MAKIAQAKRINLSNDILFRLFRIRIIAAALLFPKGIFYPAFSGYHSLITSVGISKCW
jgi:hypothetical protein